MKHPEFNSYCFKDRAHWRVGAIDNLQTTNDNGLAVLAGLVVEPVADSGSEDQTPALDYGPCDHLYWVRSDSRELVRLYDFGPQTVGTLSEAEGPAKLAVGKDRLWLLTKTKINGEKSKPDGYVCKPEDYKYRINSYAMRGLYPLRQLKPQRPILDMAGDGCNGVWWLEGGDQDNAMLYHADRYGCTASLPPLPMLLDQAALDVTCCRNKIVILDTKAPEFERGTDPYREGKAQWRLIIVDCDDGKPLIYDDIGSIDDAFQPQRLTIDNEQQIHLFGHHKAQLCPHKAQLWTLNLDGTLIAQRHPQLPQVAAISAGHHIAAATAAGIVHLRPADTTTRQGEERTSTFITPTLISPDGTPRGWQRADIEVVLPEGTTLEVICATRDGNRVSEIDRILKDGNHSPAHKVDKLNERLSWREQDRVVYVGSDVDDGVARLRYPLHQVDQTHLWLRFTLYTPPGRRPPALKALSVYYPNLSYLRYLPAVYQEDPTSAAALRRFLAIFEALFGDLDAAIDQLPNHIDPDTAPPSWLPFLLRWLGLPSPDGLSKEVRRDLLKEAPKLLAGRGTYNALHRLLEIITKNGDVSIQIDDRSAGPAPWILQPDKRRAIASRLGRDTLIVSRQPPAFRLGEARLGSSKGVPLGVGRTDPKQVFAHHTGELRLRIGATGALRQRLEPIIKVFLPYFVPAHCRPRLEFVSSTLQPWRQRLDGDLRLMDGAAYRLGSETIVGQFRLPATTTDEIILDRSSYLERGLHLN